MINLNIEEKIIEFISFCVETFKVKHKMRGKDVANLFNKSGVIDFLIEGYDILHTQSKDYILSEIEVFLKNRGYELW